MADYEPAFTQQHAFSTVDALVKSWNLAPYVHHVRHVRDRAEQGQDFVVIFSMPQPTKPVSPVMAQAKFNVRPPRGEGDAPKATYTVETQKQRFPAEQPIRKHWLDAVIRRKMIVTDSTKTFVKTGKLAPPVPFVPGKYMAEAAMKAEAASGLRDNAHSTDGALQDLAVA